MVGYLDSSVFLQYILLDDQSIRQVETCDFLISSELLKIESYRVIHRCRLENWLDDEGYYKAQIRLERYIRNVSMIIMAAEIKKRASKPFPAAIKTLDALHLSSALAYQARIPDEKILVFSLDKQFNRCARTLGFITPFMIDEL